MAEGWLADAASSAGGAGVTKLLFTVFHCTVKVKRNTMGKIRVIYTCILANIYVDKEVN